MNIELHDELQALNDDGKSQDEILCFLSSKGCSITDAITSIRALYSIKLDEAKRIVSSSYYWANIHDNNKNLHNSLEEISGICEESTEHKQDNMNAINVIAPYKYLDMWVFDDDRVGLVREPFVGGSDAMITRVVADIPNAERGFVMLFSGTPFPEYSIKLEWRRADSRGNWYYSEQLDMEGWLCPALFRYFTKTPLEIFIQARPKTE